MHLDLCRCKWIVASVRRYGFVVSTGLCALFSFVTNIGWEWNSRWIESNQKHLVERRSFSSCYFVCSVQFAGNHMHCFTSPFNFFFCVSLFCETHPNCQNSSYPCVLSDLYELFLKLLADPIYVVIVQETHCDHQIIRYVAMAGVLSNSSSHILHLCADVSIESKTTVIQFNATTSAAWEPLYNPFDMK